MSPVLPDPAVLARYGAAVAGLRWVPIAGGFSGARVWRGEDGTGTPALALKAWPPDGMTADRLARIHRLMLRAVHLPFVPTVLPAPDRSTVVTEAGRVWDMNGWMPGTADFHSHPTPARLANACAALAQLHAAWAPPVPAFAPCPAVRRRLRVLADWRAVRPGLHVSPSSHLGLAGAVRRGAEAVARLATLAERALAPWADRPVPVRPCLCDVWHDHVLFVGDEVGGVIDYGAVKDDHVAVDLARLLGSLVGDDEGLFAAGLAAYRAAGGPLDLPDGFVRLLDRTGVLCGVAVWLLRLAVEGRPFTDPGAVAARLDGLVSRLARLESF